MYMYKSNFLPYRWTTETRHQFIKLYSFISEIQNTKSRLNSMQLDLGKTHARIFYIGVASSSFIIFVAITCRLNLTFLGMTRKGTPLCLRLRYMVTACLTSFWLMLTEYRDYSFYKFISIYQLAVNQPDW